MNQLLIQNLNNKFINNLYLSETNFCNKFLIDTKSQLYRLYYKYKFTDIIFINSLLDNEEYQFIDEFGNHINIFIYIDSIEKKYLKCKSIKGLLTERDLDKSSIKTIKIPKLVNYDLFKIDSNKIRYNQIISFLDNIESLSQDVEAYLYPNKKLPIKLFNNSSIIHPQNLGLISEKDKADLLQQSKYYLSITDEYVPEALSCGCSVLSIQDLETMGPSKHKYPEAFQSYSKFLKGALRVKK